MEVAVVIFTQIVGDLGYGSSQKTYLAALCVS